MFFTNIINEKGNPFVFYLFSLQPVNWFRRNSVRRYLFGVPKRISVLLSREIVCCGIAITELNTAGDTGKSKFRFLIIKFNQISFHVKFILAMSIFRIVYVSFKRLILRTVFFWTASKSDQQTVEVPKIYFWNFERNDIFLADCSFSSRKIFSAVT